MLDTVSGQAGVSHSDEESQPDARTTRWDDHKAQRRELLLVAAIDAIGDQGGDVAVSDFASRAGIPRSVVYRIFEDRQDLDEQIRARIVELLMADLGPALTPGGTVRQTLTGAIRTYIDWVAEHPRLHQFLGTGSAARRTTGSRVVTGTRSAIARDFGRQLGAILRASDADPAIAESLAFGLVGLVDGSVNRWVNSRSPQVSAKQLAAFLAESSWLVLRTAVTEAGLKITDETILDDLL